MYRLRGLRLSTVVVASSIAMAVILYLKLTTNHQERSHFAFSQFVVSDREQRCLQPKLPLWPDNFRHFFVDHPKPVCDPQDWIYVDNGKIRFSQEAKQRNGEFTCKARPIIRRDDFHSELSEEVTVEDGSKIPSDFFKANCRTKRGWHHYQNYHYGIVEKPIEKSLRKVANSLDMSVMIFGFDSVSRLTWQRKLPITYDYLKNKLGATILEGYNIVGDGTPAALIPILTGKTEEELPDANRGHEGARTVDGHPWIWNEFKRSGYVTQFSEDGPSYSTFNYRMLGFKHQPTHHYMRTYYLEVEQNTRKSFCLGSKLRHNLMLEYMRDLFLAYPDKRKFSLGFLSQLSHDDNNPLSMADEDFRDFLDKLDDLEILDQTLLVVMSDHGARFQRLRNTIQGNYEERNPFVSIRLPGWFRTKYPESYANLQTNAKRLTTPFDIHETLKSILDFQPPNVGDIGKRGISLFSEIPKQRTCETASIEPHWCSCMNWQPLNVNDHIVKSIAKTFSDFINSILVPEFCEPLHLKKIFRASKFQTNRDFSHGNEREIEYYQLGVQTSPGGGTFEFTVSYWKVGDPRIEINKKSISRTNKYGHASDCIGDLHPHLRLYCVCKS